MITDERIVEPGVSCDGESHQGSRLRVIGSYAATVGADTPQS